MNQPVPEEGDVTTTVYTVESDGDISSDILITMSTNSSTFPAAIIHQLTQPLTQTLTDICK